MNVRIDGFNYFLDLDSLGLLLNLKHFYDQITSLREISEHKKNLLIIYKVHINNTKFLKQYLFIKY